MGTGGKYESRSGIMDFSNLVNVFNGIKFSQESRGVKAGLVDIKDVFGDICHRAIDGRNVVAFDFLVVELRGSDQDLRLIALEFLSQIPYEHPKRAIALKEISDLIVREKNQTIKNNARNIHGKLMAQKLEKTG